MRSTKASLTGAELADEEAVQLCRQIARRCSDCAASALIRSRPSCMPSAAARAGNRPAAVGVDREAERLRGGVVLAGVVDELVVLRAVGRGAGARQVPAGEHARAGIDVVLGEGPDAHREQLHDLAARSSPAASPCVFVRPSSQTSIAVSFAMLTQDVAEVAERVVAQHLDLAAHPPRILRRLRRHVARRLRPHPARRPPSCSRSRNGCARRASSSPAAAGRCAPCGTATAGARR